MRSDGQYRSRFRDFILTILITSSLFTAAESKVPVRPVAAAVQLCVWPGSTGTSGCEARPPIELNPGEQVQLYAALLRSDGTVECEVPTGALAAGCDSAAALLDMSLVQDTIMRVIQFSWPRQQGMEDYNIVVTSVSTFMAGLDTILSDTSLVWNAGAADSLYWVKGAARYRGVQASFGDSVQFSFPTPVVVLPLGPIVVDTIP